MKINFDDYDCITDKEIVLMDKNGIHFLNGAINGYIDFNECAVNYYEINGGSRKCVGERDLTALCFDFYTSPKCISIVFLSKNRQYELFSKNSAIKRFQRFQKKLNQYGFTTRDMS